MAMLAGFTDVADVVRLLPTLMLDIGHSITLQLFRLIWASCNEVTHAAVVCRCSSAISGLTPLPPLQRRYTSALLPAMAP